MIYKKFTIKNFKGIENITINFQENRILTLVGLNESGKTTIMEAMDLFYDMVKGKKPANEQLNAFRPKGIAFTGAIEIEGELELDDEDINRISKYWKRTLKKRTKLEIPRTLNINFQFFYNLHSYTYSNEKSCFNVKTMTSSEYLCNTDSSSYRMLLQRIKEVIIPEVLYFDDFIFQIPDTVKFIPTKYKKDDDVEDPNNMIWRLVINDILKSVNASMDFQIYVVDIWEKDRDAAKNRLSQMEGALNTKITERWGDLFGKNKLNFKEIILDPEYVEGKFFLAFKIRTESRKEFSVKERSKGFKWFFSFLLFTEFRKRRTKNILFLLDEPASNLHSSAQAKILDALNELSKDSLVIYSTHSHHLVNPTWLIGAYVCINENLSEDTLKGNLNLNEGAKINAIKYFDYVGKGQGSDKVSYYQPILDRLDYKPGILEPIPKIVVQEGKYDWYLVNYVQDVILKRKSKLNFYPGGGKDKLYDIIRLYLCWGKSFIVLLDGDDGKKSKDKYIKEFGEYLKDKIFTLFDIFDKEITIEDLVSVSDQRKIYDSSFGKGCYDASKQNTPKKLKEGFNYAVNLLYIQKIDLSLTKATMENFVKYFDFVEEKLNSALI